MSFEIYKRLQKEIVLQQVDDKIHVKLYPFLYAVLSDVTGAVWNHLESLIITPDVVFNAGSVIRENKDSQQQVMWAILNAAAEKAFSDVYPVETEDAFYSYERRNKITRLFWTEDAAQNQVVKCFLKKFASHELVTTSHISASDEVHFYFDLSKEIVSTFGKLGLCFQKDTDGRFSSIGLEKIFTRHGIVDQALSVFISRVVIERNDFPRGKLVRAEGERGDSVLIKPVNREKIYKWLTTVTKEPKKNDMEVKIDSIEKTIIEIFKSNPELKALTFQRDNDGEIEVCLQNSLGKL